MSVLWLIKNSIKLDLLFIKISKWPFLKKIYFIAHKYFLIIKHTFMPFKLSQSKTSFMGKDIYYDSRYGLVGYQSMMTRHQYLIQLANPSKVKTVIDVGANVGFFSMLIRDIFPSSKIYSIEPVPLTYSCLKRNLVGDRKTHTYNLGVSDRPRIAKMNFNSQLSAISQISSAGDIDVKLTTLDKFIRDNQIDMIDILKIDTEGHELNVLKGAKKALSKTRYLHIEVTVNDIDSLAQHSPRHTFSEIFSCLYAPTYNFQLLSYRSFTDSGMSKATVFDLFLKNTNIS